MVGLPGLSVPLGGVGESGPPGTVADGADWVVGVAGFVSARMVWLDDIERFPPAVSVELFFPAGLAARPKIASEILETQRSPHSRVRVMMNPDLDEFFFFIGLIGG